jgi:hypothetical protein
VRYRNQSAKAETLARTNGGMGPGSGEAREPIGKRGCAIFTSIILPVVLHGCETWSHVKGRTPIEGV